MQGAGTQRSCREPAATPIQVLIADGHNRIRGEMRALLEAQGFGIAAEAGDGIDAVRLARRLRPAVSVLDAALPRLAGLAAGRLIRHGVPETRVVLLALHSELPYVFDAMSSGIHGYVRRQRAGARLVPAIRAVARGRLHLCPDVLGPVLRHWAGGFGDAPLPLDHIGLRIVQMLARGAAIEDAAAGLFLPREEVEDRLSDAVALITRSLCG